MIKISKSRKIKAAIIGTDKRLMYCAECLAQSGYSVKAPADDTVSEFDNSIKGADIAVLGVPLSNDDRYVASLGESLKISLEHLFEKCSVADCSVICGMVSENAEKTAEKYGVRIFDYQKDEAYLLRNAKTTATAALSFMMNKLDKSPDETSALIVGNGRVGRALSRVLSAIGADVTVCARSKTDLAFAGCMGLDTFDISDGVCDLPFCDILFNTVPNMIFTVENVAAIPENALVCNLASKNGGFSEDAIKALGTRYTLAKSLPGAVFPESAGCELAEAVMDIVEREGLK